MGIEQFYVIGSRVGVVTLFVVAAYALHRGWLTMGRETEREKEITEKTMGLLAAADVRVEEAKEQIRRAKDVAVKATERAKQCENHARAVEAELAKCKAEGGRQ